MIDDHPLAIGGIYQRTMAFAPPPFVLTPGMYQRIIRRILPRTVDRPGTGLHHHMTGGRSGRTTLCIQVVIVFSDTTQFRTFQAHALGDPFVRIFPTAVNHLLCTFYDRQSVGRQFDALASTHEHPSLTILTYHMTRIDITDLQINRITPGAIRRRSINHIVAAPFACHRKIDIILVFILTDIRCPHTTQIGLQRITDRFPMHQILTVEHH